MNKRTKVSAILGCILSFSLVFSGSVLTKGGEVNAKDNVSFVDAYKPITRVQNMPNFHKNIKYSKVTTTSVALQTLDAKRKAIQTKYNVQIKYGKEVNSYYATSLLTDTAKINDMLTVLDTELAKYPSGFFTKIEQGGYTLTINLVNGIERDSNILGLSVYSRGTYNVFIKDEGSDQNAYTLNHELMHIIDYDLMIRYNYDSDKTNDAFKNWNSYNPSGYSYSTNYTYNNKYVYKPLAQGGNPSTWYFMTLYGTSDAFEDRAEIFADLMTKTTKGDEVTQVSQLKNKELYLVKEIDRGIDNTNGQADVTETWEKLLQ